eukprot:CAMPEP_0202958186 /NCGR_PEP_ID=MMETSP1396-20130829/2550_1 /ASSEMBLY_ACC=CAM_ASM_000872 /TAXON_ID= /ORGANISM="Pseudokeronopsis sp., Strain Brazil" /LENGTH=61 /DNA_ID=CAMNT_0049676109 /DNA_START=161 /DNA_END=346 /DNA_ORIENTATION=+
MAYDPKQSIKKMFAMDKSQAEAPKNAMSENFQTTNHQFCQMTSNSQTKLGETGTINEELLG